MKLIKPSTRILEQKSNLESIYEAIETAGRLCYKSERPEGKTAKEFVDKLINMKHFSVLEHGTVYLKIPKVRNVAINHTIFNNPYTKWTIKNGDIYLTTNYRVLYENDWMYLLKYLCKPTKLHEKRMSVHFVTSIGIVRELLRHRKFSFSNESTRYCSYNKAHFGREITYIIPSWSTNIIEGNYPSFLGHHIAPGKNGAMTEGFIRLISHGEKELIPMNFNEIQLMSMLGGGELYYMDMINEGATPQEAREVLPLATKSELIMTGFESDWKDLFTKRSSIAATGKPHPQMVELIDPLMEEFNKKM